MAPKLRTEVGFCAVLRGPWGHGHDAHDCTGVFSWHHGRRSDVHQRDEAGDADHDQCYGENRTLDEAQHVFLIFLQDVVVAMIEGILEFLRTHADQSDDTDDAEGCGDDWMLLKIESTEYQAQHADDDQNHGH